MKKIFQKQFYVAAYVTLVLLFVQVVTFAQDGNAPASTTTTTSSTSTSSTEPMAVQPWMWIVGGAIVLIIIIALLRGNSSTKEVHVEKTRDIV
ncbi:MAG: hypothetical protein ABI123_10195 [Ginsengibacter sp.]|jgi:hypothetical protein